MSDFHLLEIFDKAIEDDDLHMIRECLSKGVILTSKINLIPTKKIDK